MIWYEDNAIIVSDNEDNLQRMLHKVESTVSIINITISLEKNESLTISKLAINNQSVNQVM